MLILVSGAVVGAVAGRLVGGRGFGLLGNIVIGLLGAALAYAADYFTGLYDLVDFGEGMERVERLVAALLGAVALVLLSKLRPRPKAGRQ